MGQIVIAYNLRELEANIAVLVAAAASSPSVSVATGTFSLDETSALEQDVVEVALAARTLIGGVWLDMANVTQNATVRVYHKIDGTNYRLFSEHSWLTTDDDGVLVEGFTAFRDIKVTLQCGGGGAGSVNVPYVVV